MGALYWNYYLNGSECLSFIGLKRAGPDMRNTAQTYYQEVNLADLIVSSNYGLDKNDTQTIKKQAKKSYS